MSTTALALLGFAGWQIILTIALGSYRPALVPMGRKAPNQFAADGADLAGFGQRLAHPPILVRFGFYIAQIAILGCWVICLIRG